MTEPMRTWDVREKGWQDSRGPARTAWLRAHGINDAYIYRAEFYPGSEPYVRIFCYHSNEQGQRHWNDAHVPGPHDHSNCGPAVQEPRDVPLDELPPEELP